MLITKLCHLCQKQFNIDDTDQDYYRILGLIEPNNCPDCRQQTRLAWRNEYRLYNRKCDATGEYILSVFSQDKKITVYKNDYWYSDSWNAKDYGQEYDFHRSFFQQRAELVAKVPQLARSTINNQNCDFVNQCGWSKDCYLTFEADGNHSCLYSNNIFDSRSCVDIAYGIKDELCYETVDCRESYNLKYSQNCQNCFDSWFLKNCIGSKNCFGSVNLRNKEYYFFNEKLSKEEYEKRIFEIDLTNYQNIQNIILTFAEHVKKFPNKACNGTQNDNSSGDYLWNTQRCEHCFDLTNAQDCKYVYNARNTKKVYDMMVFGQEQGAEFCCDNLEIGDGVKNIYYSDQIWSACYNIYYSKLCMQNSHDLFGCVGLRKDSYCILNKQYSEIDYKNLFPKIVEQMKSTQEWGQFPPMENSPWAYNETMAQVYYPLTKEEVIAKGLAWKDDIYTIPNVSQIIPAEQLPDTIDPIPDDVLNWAIQCERTGRPFKVIQNELKFYRDHKLPLPHLHPEERVKRRMALRNSRILWNRNCMKCNIPIQTTYASNRPEIVYCEKCCLEAVD